jgi:hypothetical protein
LAIIVGSEVTEELKPQYCFSIPIHEQKLVAITKLRPVGRRMPRFVLLTSKIRRKGDTGFCPHDIQEA